MNECYLDKLPLHVYAYGVENQPFYVADSMRPSFQFNKRFVLENVRENWTTLFEICTPVEKNERA